MRRKLVLAAATMVVLALGVQRTTDAATGVSLLVPQSTAFAILGHSCGGIQEQAFATGFDPVTGYPMGDVYLTTRCGGSGRGGGYKVTTYSAWVAVTWDFGAAVRTTVKLAAAPTVNPTLTVSNGVGALLTNSANQAYLSVNLPGVPTGVTAADIGGQVQVNWTPDPGAAVEITSTTITATPINPSGSAVIAVVAGPATSAFVALAPSTTYAIVVVNTDLAGSSPASTPVTFSTGADATPPPPPTSISAWWTGQVAPGLSLGVRWAASAAGTNTVDSYDVRVIWQDGDNPGGTYDQVVSGQTQTAYFAVDNTSNWSIQVRAHDAAGWGAWSTSIVIGGV